MADSLIPYDEIASFGLYILGTEDNIKNSQVTVKFSEPYKGGEPQEGGVSDRHMGAPDEDFSCLSCHQLRKSCPGHPGVVKLKYPVMSPLFIQDAIKWLKIICFNCGKVVIKIPPNLKVPKRHIISVVTDLVRKASTSDKMLKCTHCQTPHPHVVLDDQSHVNIMLVTYKPKEKGDTKPEMHERVQLYPHMIKKIFGKITDATVLAMGKSLDCHPQKMVLDAIAAPPNTIRPDMKRLGTTRTNNDDLTILLQLILKINAKLPDTIPTDIDSLPTINIENLNMAVYELIKGSGQNRKKRGLMSSNSKKTLASIARRLPRKYGRIRRNLMGKRVGYMGRSFITCDCSLRLDELGVPISMVKNLQKPEIVRDYNFDQMMVYFMNGTERYPGASKVKKASTGDEHWIGGSLLDNFTLEVGDIIYRDLVDGDIIGFNRQPTLEDSSISSFTVRIMEKGDSIRMNVLVCPLFNADFKPLKSTVTRVCGYMRTPHMENAVISCRC